MFSTFSKGLPTTFTRWLHDALPNRTARVQINKAPAVLPRGRYLKLNVMELSAVEVMLSKGNDSRFDIGILMRKHAHDMLEMFDLEDSSSLKRHLDQV